MYVNMINIENCANVSLKPDTRMPGKREPYPPACACARKSHLLDRDDPTQKIVGVLECRVTLRSELLRKGVALARRRRQRPPEELELGGIAEGGHGLTRAREELSDCPL